MLSLVLGPEHLAGLAIDYCGLGAQSLAASAHGLDQRALGLVRQLSRDEDRLVRVHQGLNDLAPMSSGRASEAIVYLFELWLVAHAFLLLAVVWLGNLSIGP